MKRFLIVVAVLLVACVGAADDRGFWQSARTVWSPTSSFGQWQPAGAGEAHLLAPCGLRVKWPFNVRVASPDFIYVDTGSETFDPAFVAFTLETGEVVFDEAGTYLVTLERGNQHLLRVTTTCE